jgi:RimJ/RimL family protein N-acetyltransferase
VIIEVNNENQIDIVESLAREIWTEHYTPIIGKDQVEYMLDKFQSKDAISHQIESEGFLYFLIEEEGKYIGYLGVQAKGLELFLSKIYVHASNRGKGFGKKAIQFLENLANKLHLNKISLTVNKNNIKSIKAYEKMGFKNLGPVVQDIGSGFIMDDFKMEKIISFSANNKN